MYVYAGLGINVVFSVVFTTDEDDHQGAMSIPNHQEKLNYLKAVENAASVSLHRHHPLFLHGLHLDAFPTVQDALSGKLPINENSKEKQFLLDFISAAPDSGGGRLAR